MLCKAATLSDDPEDQAGKEELNYALDEAMLEIDFKTKALKGFATRRVLVSPRTDLFAEEVPANLIRKVLHAAAEAKDFDFLFTTGNPERLQEFSWESNTFAGVSIFEQKDVAPAENALLEMDDLRKWLVVEQLTMELTFEHLEQLDWIVVREGAGSLGAVQDRHAMKSLLEQAWAANCPIFFETGVTFRSVDEPKALAESIHTEDAGND